MSLETDKNRMETSRHERRADSRIVVNVQVEVTTINHHGSPITERTYIEDVSDFGCRFSMRGPVRKGDTVAIQLIAPDGKIESDEPAKKFEVMWIARAATIVVVGARVVEGEKLDTAKLSQNSVNRDLPHKSTAK